MIARVAFALFVLAGCVEDNLVPCDDGRACPAGTVCTPTSCADGTAVAACDGLSDGAACTFDGLADGVCASSICTLRGCGNGAVDEGSSETCDDGNTVTGDGCTSTCLIEGCGNGTPDASETCDDSNTISHDGCSATCARETPQWTSLEPSTDDERRGAAVAFVASRNAILRFGGVDVHDTARSGTFELQGNRWERILTAHAPSARGFAASAYDTARGRWVIFGGTGIDALADTWELDATDWIPINASGPPAGEHAMTYDAKNARTVMVCEDGTTWTYNGTTWTPLAGTQPPARRSTALAYDATTERVVLFGGVDAGTALDDVWVLDGAAWTPLTTTGTPAARSGHSLIYDPTRAGLVLQGGATDTWLLQGSTWTPVAGTQARFAKDLSLAFDPVRNKVLRYGGAKGFFVFDDLYELDSTGWQRTSSPGPLDRSATLFATDTKRDRIVMFGGFSWAESWLEPWATETWAYDATGWHRLNTTNNPPNTAAEGMAYDPVRDRIVVVNASETWEFDGTDWALVTTAVNTPNIGGPIVYDAARARMVAMNAQTHVYDGVDWTALPGVPGVTQLSEYAAAYDDDRERVVLFDRLNTWELDGDAWVMVGGGMDGGERRYRAVMARDPIRHRLILVGGATDSTGKQNDTWEWDGASWTRVVTTGTYTAREWTMFAWLPSAASFVLFGGNDRDITLHDTWLLHWDPLP